jgi:benzodiazapine receptor
MGGVTSAAPPGLARQIGGLAGWLLLCFAAAGIGAIASADASTFYAQLVRPDWAPPAWLFAPVWTALYAMMGISAWLVWKEYTFIAARTALSMFIVQLVVNALWSWVFFAWRQGGIAFAEVLLLWCLVAVTVAMFWRLRTVAALLLLPYLAWVTFATALTFSTWRLNPGLL